MITYLLIIFLAGADRGWADLAEARFQAARAARSPGELDQVVRRFDLLEASLAACRRELANNLIPVNCYRAGELDPRAWHLATVEPRELDRRCVQAAQTANRLPAKDAAARLPASCGVEIEKRRALLIYKYGKELE